MTQIINSLADIQNRYDAVFCDLWGCLHNGLTAFPAAVEALRGFKANGGTVLLLTNSPRPKDRVIDQLDGLNVPRDCWDEIATSGDAAQAALVAGQFGQKVYHLGPERDLSFFTDMAPDIIPSNPVEITRVPLKDAEGVVCTGLFDDETETPEDYRADLLLAKTMGLKLLCANPDVIVDRGEKRLYCAGALAEAYSQMGGQSFYFGKPHPPIYDLARRRLAAIANIPDERILAIGDGPATDVLGGRGEDLDTLFVTGGLAAAPTGTALAPDSQPDPVKLDAYLTAQSQSPQYSIGFLR